MTTNIIPPKTIHGTIEYRLTKQELDEAVRRYIISQGNKLGQMKSSYSVSCLGSLPFSDSPAFVMTFYYAEEPK